jgi:Tol biopolymer transport system component
LLWPAALVPWSGGQPATSANRAGPGPIRQPFTLQTASSYHTAAFSPDGKWLASPGLRNAVTLWDVVRGKEVRSFTGHRKDVFDVVFSPDGKWLAGAGREGAKLWNAATGKEVFTTHGQAWTTRVAFSPDGKQLASAGNGGIRLWETATGRQIGSFPDRSSWVSSVSFSPDGKRLACGNMNKEVRIWAVATGREDRVLLGHTSSIHTVAFSPDGRLLASSSVDKTVKLWDAVKGQELLTLRGHLAAVHTIAFSPDGKRLVTASGDKTVKLWEVRTGQVQWTLQGHTGAVYAAAFSPDGKRLATTGSDGKLFLWALGRLQERPDPLTAAQLDGLWTDLGGADAPKAFRAVFALSAAPRQTVPYLKQRLRPAATAPLDVRRLARLIADLDANRYAVRRKATRELADLGKGVEPALRQALLGRRSLEAQRRLERLVARLERAAPSPEQLLAQRATEVLERIGTPEALAVLKRLARGAQGAWLTVEARASVRRLTGRADPIP